MSKFKFMRKTQLSLALSAVLAGGMLASPAQAVQLAQDGLGDAVIFPYFTAKGNWQTFVRLINTSDNAVVVKVRFREAANSRELQDFLVALSPNDMWSAWTDDTAWQGRPGIRTNDTSCIFDLPNTGSTTFNTISGNLKGVAFSNLAFTDASGSDYSDGADNSTASTNPRLSEGYIEVIGVSMFGPASPFARAVTHNQATGIPENCTEARNLFRDPSILPFPTLPGQLSLGFDVGNVIGANAQLINVVQGEGAGYDPVVLANFKAGPFSLPLRQETLLRLTAGGVGYGSWPSLDSADPHSLMLTDGGSAIVSAWDVDGNGLSSFGSNDVAMQQLLADGSVASRSAFSGDMNRNGNTNQTITVQDINGNVIGTASESDIPASIVSAIAATGKVRRINATTIRIVVSTTPNVITNPVANGDIYPFAPVATMVPATAASPVRLTNIAHENDASTADNNAVRGGIDAVSAVLARRSIINEWAASPTPANVVTDYYTQWVVTFPTKHYYVDLQDDPNLVDRFAPTLVDPRGDAGTDLNDAFAPFSLEFNTAAGSAGSGVANAVGQSCEPYDMVLWDREESMRGFNSPADYEPSRLCNEVNVLSFSDAYATRGLDSSFGAVVPESLFPPNAMASTFEPARRGWARMTFTGTGTNTGLTGASAVVSAYATAGLLPQTLLDPAVTSPTLVRYEGLPVVGFQFTSYNTNGNNQNHNAINAHKYERDIETVTGNSDFAGVNASNATKGNGLADLDGDGVTVFNDGNRIVNP
ncbi:MAG: hypothetical protein KDI44_04445 [Thiothrix sp.]|nr:hypothetical protein [Thiothrix sp.]